jgi:zinc transport system ATP-binding protein
MAEPLVVVSGLSVRMGGGTVLDRIDLSLPPGEVVTVVGPNGAGKTTLLRAVLGLVKPDAGSVRRRVGLRVGYVPQKLPLDPTLPLTVERFLALAVAGRVERATLAGVLDEVRAGRVLGRQLREISGGELQRVMLARALLRRPELLVLDEPVGNVDVAGQAELYERIARLRDETGCGVLMVSHDLHLVMAATDRVVCLNRHVCCAGSPHAVRSDPAYAELFGARVAASLAVYTHHHDHAHDAAGCVHPIKEDEHG